MPKLVNALPKYRLHKATGRAVVTLDGDDRYLGRWQSKASKTKYDRVVGEWLAAGRQLPRRPDDTTIVDLCAAYKRFAEGYYRKNGQPTRSIEGVRLTIRALRLSHGDTPVSEFGPLALQSLQQRFVSEGKGRRYVNYLTGEIKRIFKWGASREIVPAMIFHALSTVPGLRKGRTDAHESEPVLPVPDEVVDATLPFLPPVVADMVKLHRLIGCRPGELCQMRPADIDRSSDVWAYRPGSHKTEHHGRERVVFIGPKGQEILRTYLLRAANNFCFVPAESEQKRRELRHAERTTPLSYGNGPGTNRRRRRKRKPADRYDSGTYARAVKCACDAADAKAHADDESVESDKRIVPRWAPNQLRHAVATKIRKQHGLEAVQVVLGHANAQVSQIYAERDLALAATVMAKMG